MIKKHQILGLALFAVFAFSACIAAASASAVEFLLAEWLFNGNAVTAALNVETTGKLLLEDEKTLLGKAAVVCEGILDGTVNANGADTVTALLTTPGKVEVTLAGAGLACTGETLCGNTSTAYADKLPWTTTLELEEPGGAFVDLVTGAEYVVLCVVGGSTIEDTCTASAGTNTGKLTNGATDVTAVANEVTSPKSSCSQGGAGAGIVQTIEGLIADTEAGTLAVSE